MYQRSAHQTTALLSEIFLFLVMAACKLRSASYGLNILHGCFPIHHFVHNYTHNLKTKGRIRMFYLSNDHSTIRDISIPWVRAVNDGRLMDPNMQRYYLLIQQFVCTYTRNSKSTGCIWTFYTSNDCFTIGDVYFLCQSWIQNRNGKLWLQTCITVSIR